jgi:hypothetical protein
VTARPPKILIATPCYGGLVTNYYLMSLLAMTRVLGENGIAYDVRTVTDSLISRARNHIASQFLHDESFTHLFFIDADLGFDASAILRYLSFGKDVVCGVYPLKRLDVAALRATPEVTDAVAEAASYKYSSTLSFHDGNTPVDGFLRVEYAATGFMFIAKAVLETMATSYPQLRYGGDHSLWSGTRQRDSFYAFFDTMIADGQSLPEDYSFCRRWRDIGGEIWVDLRSRFSHVGTHVYNGDLAIVLAEAKRRGHFK